MPSTSGSAPLEPLLVSILRQGPHLIASVHSALDDSQLVRFQQDLLERIGADRARGVVIDVAALDVLDSFAATTLRTIGDVARLRGARTVIVGIHPDIAYALVQLGLNLGRLETALDLEEGLALLDRPGVVAADRAAPPLLPRPSRS